MSKLFKKIIGWIIALIIAVIVFIISELKKLIHHKKIQDYSPKENNAEEYVDKQTEDYLEEDEFIDILQVKKDENQRKAS